MKKLQENSVENFNEIIVKHKIQNDNLRKVAKAEKKSTIFISHRSTDKLIADMILDFLVGTGIPKKFIFCSSLPGNDIREKISDEVKSALKDSVINIAIVSKDYYQSAYCLNEAGIMWFQDDIPTIIIALPEINSSNMYGFLNNEYKLRRLEVDTDISYIYDIVVEATSTIQVKVSVITNESQKLINRYNQYLENRTKTQSVIVNKNLEGVLTDDERIILYFIIKNNVRKVSKDAINVWLHNDEIHGINIDNGFDLLSFTSGNLVDKDNLEIEVDVFRNYISNEKNVIPELEQCVEKHKRLASDAFIRLWNSGGMEFQTHLFLAYIIDEKISNFGARWMADTQVESIKQWECKNSLEPVLSADYGSCLEVFNQYELIYESDWTSYGKAREYTLYRSLQKHLLDNGKLYYSKLDEYKRQIYLEMPF